jgi:autoinducer 2-degrading protein
MITLTVSLHVIPAYLDEFIEAITENARRSFADEPDCLYFDVCQDTSDPYHFIFHEAYTDENGIAAHRAAPHFADWRAAADVYVVPGSQVNTISRRIAHHS